MTLQLHQLTDQIEQAKLRSADRAREKGARLPGAIDALHRAALDQDLLSKAERFSRARWRGAIPAQESLDLHAAADSMPLEATIVGVDGSQIYPDLHAPALYYALNLGYFIGRLGRRETDSGSSAELVVDEERVCPGGEILSAAALNAKRSVGELTLLATLCLGELRPHSAASPPPAVLGLLDGSLALNLPREGMRSDERSQLERQYLASLEGLGEKQVPVAGYVSRPWGSPVLALLGLCQAVASDLEKRPGAPQGSQAPHDLANPFRPLADREVFAEFLPPGERSALFEHSSDANEPFRRTPLSHIPGTTHSTHFFYLNVGRESASIARVDIPAWVAKSPRHLGLVHTLVLDQCRVTLSDPYPYALIRADEEAVVRSEEKRHLEAMIQSGLMAEGLEAVPSEKLAQKGKARYRTGSR
ncbi:MAG: DNA double-strand break repair nuclease NurA [Anaerolineales bacterium]|jgi:hypothetical protein